VVTVTWAFTSEQREVSFGVFFLDGFEADYRQAELACLRPIAAYDAHLQEVAARVSICLCARMCLSLCVCVYVCVHWR
jgi:hypothetical protein